MSSPIYCPRCDRLKEDWPELLKHVELAHPDYDVEWANDTIYYTKKEDQK